MALTTRAFYSSFLFLLPAYISAVYTTSHLDVALSCITCMFTSLLNHAHKTENRFLQKLDQYTVRSIALVYVTHCMLMFGNSVYTVLTIAFGILTASLYVYVLSTPRTGEQYHYIVHILANCGILTYIIGRHRLLQI